MESNVTLRTVDIAEVTSTQITTALSTSNIVSQHGEAFVAIETTQVVAQETLFKSTHTAIIQNADIINVEAAYSAAFKATLESKCNLDYKYFLFRRMVSFGKVKKYLCDTTQQHITVPLRIHCFVHYQISYRLFDCSFSCSA